MKGVLSLVTPKRERCLAGWRSMVVLLDPHDSTRTPILPAGPTVRPPSSAPDMYRAPAGATEPFAYALGSANRSAAPSGLWYGRRPTGGSRPRLESAAPAGARRTALRAARRKRQWPGVRAARHLARIGRLPTTFSGGEPDFRLREGPRDGVGTCDEATAQIGNRKSAIGNLRAPRGPKRPIRPSFSVARICPRAPTSGHHGSR